jgi:hypothetical protein
MRWLYIRSAAFQYTSMSVSRIGTALAMKAKIKMATPVPKSLLFCQDPFFMGQIGSSDTHGKLEKFLAGDFQATFEEARFSCSCAHENAGSSMQRTGSLKSSSWDGLTRSRTVLIEPW